MYNYNYMKNTIKKVKVLSLTAVFALSASFMFLPFSVRAATVDSSNPTVAITSPAENAVVSGMSSIVVDTTDAYSSCVVTLFGSNYDVSPLQTDHSGGNLFICGTDMTTTYQSEHGTNLSRVASYLIPASYTGVDKVEFYFDGMLFGTDMTAPYSFNWNTAIFADGIHALAALAYDQAGNTSTYSMVNITIDNTPADEDPVITSIALTPTTSSIYMGDTVQLTAVALDQYGNPLAVQPSFDWMSNITSIAMVNATGLVTGVNMGSATITVIDDVSNVSKTAVVHVTNVPDEDPVLTSISLTPATSIIIVGNNVQLNAVAKDQYGNPLAVQPSFNWLTNDTSIAMVNATGLVTGNTVGSATIVAYTAGSFIGAIATVDVVNSPATPVLTSISLTPATSSINVGNTVQLNAVAKDQYGNPLVVQPSFNWLSNNTGIAMVNSTGLVTGNTAGSSIITASVTGSSITATATVDVVNVPPAVTGKIKVEMENGKAEIHIKVNGMEDEFKMYNSTKAEIVAAIAARTGLTIEQVLQIAEFDMHNENEQGNENGNEHGNDQNNGNGDDEDEDEDRGERRENHERRNNENNNHHENSD